MMNGSDLVIRACRKAGVDFGREVAKATTTYMKDGSAEVVLEFRTHPLRPDLKVKFASEERP